LKASGPAAHLAASVWSGSTSSQRRHLNSVLPLSPRTTFMRLLQCGQRSTELSLFPGPTSPWNKGSNQALSIFRVKNMQAAVDRVMKTYGMMVNLTMEDERSARDRVAEFLSGRIGDENKLAIEGLRFLRGDKLLRVRRARPAV
jgi:hypothetical protein